MSHTLLSGALVTSVEKGDNAIMSSVRLRSAHTPRCIVIAGPNGAGKTTFAREFLPREGGVIHFVNADLIASGLSPLRPELATRRGGRLVLTELSRLVKGRQDFAFESTLSGWTYLPLLRGWKASGVSDRTGVPVAAVSGAGTPAYCSACTSGRA